MSILEIVLYPFSVIYDFATSTRNYLFDIEKKKSFRFEANVISVGNLSVGGTGKTPMIEYLIRLLGDQYKVTTLSRGYGRKTSGFRIAGKEDSSKTIGDEPYQFYNKFSDIKVTVGEQRAVAIPFILAELPDTDVILLDDAYQHRYVDPSLNILLTDYQKPFFRDMLLPSGRLRESRRGAKRADIIVVTKCPNGVDQNVINDYTQQIRNYSKTAEIFFSSIEYDTPQPIYDKGQWQDEVLLFSGIANDDRLKEYVDKKYNLKEVIKFSDHQAYGNAEVKKIKDTFEKILGTDHCILTTEKDMVKLIDNEIDEELKALPIFYLPIRFRFLKDGKRFEEIVLNSIRTYSN
ncbi:MAG: tetraacyldisaccharide 4'-kinase [Bacteroidota bacterium]